MQLLAVTLPHIWPINVHPRDSRRLDYHAESDGREPRSRSRFGTVLALVGAVSIMAGWAQMAQAAAPTLTGDIDDQILTQGTAYTSAAAFPVATGGDVPITYSVANLPSGITLNSARKLTGTAIAVLAKKQLTYKATDVDGDEATLTFNISVKPQKPADFGAAAGDGEVTLSWTPLAGVDDWQYKQDSGSWMDIPYSGASTARRTVEGLTNGTAYTFKVRALVGFGNTLVTGVESDPATATPTPTTGPTVTITGVPKITMSTFTATFIFTEAVTGFVVGDITLYNLSATTFSGSGTTYTAKLTPWAFGGDAPQINRRMYLRVSAGIAQNSSGVGNQQSSVSSIRHSKRPSLTISGVPSTTSVSFTATFKFSKNISHGQFTASDVKLTNATITDFTRTSGSGDFGKQYTATITPTADGAFTVSVPQDAVPVNTTQSINTLDHGNKAASASGTFTMPTAPVKPTGFIATTGNAQVFLSWTDPGDDTLIGYQVRSKVATGTFLDSDWQDIAGSNKDTVSHTVTGLTNGTEYKFQIRAVNLGPDGTASDIKTAIPKGENPRVTSIERQNPSWYIYGERTKKDILKWRVTFDEDVKDVDATDFSVSGTTATLAVAPDGTSKTVYDVTASGGNIANLDVTVTLGFASGQNITDDQDDNALTNTTPTGTNENSYQLDNTAPSVTSIKRQSPTFSPTDADELTWRVTFSEQVWDVEATNDFSVSISPTPANAPTLTVARVGGFDFYDLPVSSQFNVKLSGGDLATLTGTVTLKVFGKFVDTADIDLGTGNLLDVNQSGHTPTGINENTFVVDNISPRVTISDVPATTNEAFTATFTFSETVSGFVVGDITLTGATASAFTETVTGSTWTALITPTADYTVKVAAGVATDTDNNDNLASDTKSGTYDTTAPTVAITDVPATTGGAFTTTFTFSETVSGFVVGDITLENATASAFTETVTGTTWTALITPMVDGEFSVSVAANAATDDAGNGNTASATKSGTYDTSVLSVTITGVPTATNAAFTATFTFSKAVTDFVVGDITLTGATASAFTETVTGTTWTALITPTADYTVKVAAGVATDTDNNGNLASATKSGTYDTTAPTVAITDVPATTGAAFTATFTFSETVSDFEVGDITLTGATASNFTNTVGTTWTTLITPTTDYSVSVAAGVATDAAGNGNTASATHSGTYDTTAPTVAITDVPATTGAAFTVTFAFSETVSGFVVGDITLVNATASAFKETVTGTTWTATITPRLDGDYSVSVAAGVATDAAGNGNTASDTKSGTFTGLNVTITGAPKITRSAFTATFTFSETVSDFVVGDITLGNLTASNFRVVSGTTYTATFTPGTGINDGRPQEGRRMYIKVNAGVATNASGMVNQESLVEIRYHSRPSLTISGVPSTTSVSFTATFKFSRSIRHSEFTASDVNLTNATISNFTRSVGGGISGKEYTATITPKNNGTFIVSVMEDAVPVNTNDHIEFLDLGNKPASASGMFTKTNPRVESIEWHDPSVSPTDADTLTWRVTFDENVMNVDATDFTVSRTTATLTVTADGASKTVYDVTVSGGDLANYSGTVTLGFADDQDIIQDKPNGNALIDTTPFETNEPTYVVDNAPMVVINGVPPATTSPFTATFTFSKAVTGFDGGDITLTGATASNFTETVTGTTWTALITPTADYSVSVEADVATDTDDTPTGNLASNVEKGTYTELAEENTLKTILSDVTRSIGYQTMSAISQRVEQSASGVNQEISGFASSQESDPFGIPNFDQSMTVKEWKSEDFLNGGRIAINLNSADASSSQVSGKPLYMLWSSGNYQSLGDDNGPLTYDGSLASLSFGVDARLDGGLLAGVAVFRFNSDLDYNDSQKKGKQDLSITSVNPYVGLTTDDYSIWSSIGVGSGDLDVQKDVSKSTLLSSGLKLRTASIGASGIVWRKSSTTFRLKGDYSQTRLEVGAAKDVGATKGYKAFSVNASRARVSVQASQHHTLKDGAAFEPNIELGIRSDGGDGQTGSSVELGAGMTYTVPSRRMALSLTAHALVESDEHDEWGIQGTVQMNPAADGRGLSFSVVPAYGTPVGGVEKIWQLEQPGDSETDTEPRLDARIGYGLSVPHVGGVLTPFGGMSLQDDTRSYQLGMGWKLGERMEMNLVGERSESQAAETDQGIRLQGAVRF